MAISQRLGKIFSNFQKFVFSKNFNLDAGSIFRSLRAICHERSRKNCHFARWNDYIEIIDLHTLDGDISATRKDFFEFSEVRI